MIRNQQGSEFFLFTQDDHARLAGRLADQFGNGRFLAPEPRRAVIDAVAAHDCGWVLHDDQPTLDPRGLPLHVFETPVTLAVGLWVESARVARLMDSFTGLLVSLHVFALSALAYTHHSDPEHKPHSVKELFELNKFQQLQIEMQEQIRGELGMRTDIALHLGLAPRGSGADEDELRYNYQILRAMDQVSLALLCGGRPFSTIEDISTAPGNPPGDFRIGYSGPFRLTLSPWPFDVDAIEAEVPFRRVPAKVFSSTEEFRAIYAAAPREMQKVRVAKTG